MLNEKLQNGFFSKFGKIFCATAIKKATHLAFKNHQQFSLLIDIFVRRYQHHAAIYMNDVEHIAAHFFQAFLHHLTQENIPSLLRQVEGIYLTLPQWSTDFYSLDALSHDFQQLQNILDENKKYLIIALPFSLLSGNTDDQTDSFLYTLLIKIMRHPRCRLLVFAKEKLAPIQSYFQNDFSFLNFSPLTKTDITAILKQNRTELEAFHHVIISDEILDLSYSLTKRFLSIPNALEKCLLLLDSSSGRIGMIESNDQHTSLKPILTQPTVLQVLSEWTQIPSSHLQSIPFKLNEFTQILQQKIFGQSSALTLLGQAFLQLQNYSDEPEKPFCALFAGPNASGKKTTALALTEQLFKQNNMFYEMQGSATSLLELRCQQYTTKEFCTLRDLIQRVPYPVIFWENIDIASPKLVEELSELLRTGYTRDAKGNIFYFQQTSFILATTLGTDFLRQFNQNLLTQQDSQTLDLMQLLTRNPSSEQATDLSPQEILHGILPEISSKLSTLIPYIHIIPFLPLSKSAIENIVRIKFKVFGKQLNFQHGIELGYAPEVIRFLANEIIKDSEVGDFQKTLRPIYSRIYQTINHQQDNKHRANQLFLQLTETGQALRCEWLNLPLNQQQNS